MFDFSFNELLLLSILIIIFIGPKELPSALRSIHRFFSNLWMYSKYSERNSPKGNTSQKLPPPK